MLVPALALAWSEPANNGTASRVTAIGGHLLSDRPRVHYIPEFLTADEVSLVLGALPPQPWQPVKADYADCDTADGKTEQNVSTAKLQLTAPLQPIVHKLSTLLGANVESITELPALRYAPGHTGLDVHHDRFHSDGGMPDATLLIYLTRVPPGASQTIFPDVSLQISPQPGAMLAWMNVDAQHAVDPTAAHGISALGVDAPTDRIVIQIPVNLLPPNSGLEAPRPCPPVRAPDILPPDWPAMSPLDRPCAGGGPPFDAYVCPHSVRG